jgi:hypothetical protein
MSTNESKLHAIETAGDSPISKPEKFSLADPGRAKKKRPWQGCRGLVAPIVKSGVVYDCPMGRAAACYQGAGFASMPSTSVDAHPLATA